MFIAPQHTLPSHPHTHTLDPHTPPPPHIHCRYFVLYKLPGLTFLDSRQVTAMERREAKRVGEFMRVIRPSDDVVRALARYCVCHYSPPSSLPHSSLLPISHPPSLAHSFKSLLRQSKPVGTLLFPKPLTYQGNTKVHEERVGTLSTSLWLVGSM